MHLISQLIQAHNSPDSRGFKASLSSPRDSCKAAGYKMWYHWRVTRLLGLTQLQKLVVFVHGGVILTSRQALEDQSLSWDQGNAFNNLKSLKTVEPWVYKNDLQESKHRERKRRESSQLGELLCTFWWSMEWARLNFEKCHRLLESRSKV